MSSTRKAFFGKIYTCQQEKSFKEKWVECLVIEEQILFVGSKQDAYHEKIINNETEIIELKQYSTL